MTENNAAQLGLTDDEILQVFADVVGNQEDDARFIDVDRDQAIRIARTLLSKLRAEGVQAGDERADFEKALLRRVPNAMLHRVDMKGATRLGEYCREEIEACWRLWQDRAALASAPVAGEARKPFAWVQEVPGYEPRVFLASRIKDPTQGDGWKPGVKWRALVLADAAPRASEADFSDAYEGAREDLAIWKRRALEAERDLRAERETSSLLVAELNAQNGPTHMGEPAPQASETVRNQALDDAEEAVVTLYESDDPVYLPDIALAIRALKTQADKDGGDCAKGAGYEDLLALMERAAREAGGSQWVAEGFESRTPGAAFYGGLIMNADGETVVAQCVNESNASHMMSSSPANVLWLIRQYRAALSPTQPTELGERDE